MSERRKVEIGEVVEVIEDLMEHVDPAEELTDRAEAIVNRLVGPERETCSRLTSKHLVADEELCQILAHDLAISEEEAREAFIGEPVKRVFAVAMWALDQADEDIGDGVHGQRGPRIARLIQEWAERNQAGIYRIGQPTRQYIEEGA